MFFLWLMCVSFLDLQKLITILLYVFIYLSKPTELIKNSISVFCGNDRFCSQPPQLLSYYEVMYHEEVPESEILNGIKSSCKKYIVAAGTTTIIAFIFYFSANK